MKVLILGVKVYVLHGWSMTGILELCIYQIYVLTHIQLLNCKALNRFENHEPAGARVDVRAMEK